MYLQYEITNNDIISNNYKTVKDVLISYFKISHRLLIKLKNNNYIFLNDIPTSVNTPISEKDIIKIDLSYTEDNSNIIPNENIKLEIIYEDDSYIIINKPYGIPVHPSISHYGNSLSNGLRCYYDQIGLKKKIRPVNRIDKNTSGLVVFAKNEYIQENLIRQMNNNTFNKEYIAIVEGIFENKKRNN